MIINPKDYAGYVITGVLVDRTRFRKYTLSLLYALGINLWRGSVWGMTHDCHRKLLKRVYN